MQFCIARSHLLPCKCHRLKLVAVSSNLWPFEGCRSSRKLWRIRRQLGFLLWKAYSRQGWSRWWCRRKNYQSRRSDGSLPFLNRIACSLPLSYGHPESRDQRRSLNVSWPQRRPCSRLVFLKFLTSKPRTAPLASSQRWHPDLQVTINAVDIRKP